jgi:membrane fusion protein, macrolide-specific efflux system
VKLTWKVGPLLVAALLLGVWWWNASVSSGETKKTYESVVVKRGNIRQVVLSTGTVQPENELAIKPPIDGRAEEVLVAIGDKVKKGQVLAWMSSSERAALLDVARTKGEKELERWEDFYKPAALVAPLDGTIIGKSVVPGQVVTASDTVFTMSDHLIVAASLDETDLAKIALKQKVEMVLDAYASQPFTGQVERIAYNSTTVSNVTTFEVDILPDQVPDFMRSGMTADLTFVVAEHDNVLLVPALAVTRQGAQTTVLLASDPSGAASQNQPVTLGISNGKQVEVVSGLKENDTVLVEKANLTAATSTGLLPTPSKDSGPPPGEGGPP